MVTLVSLHSNPATTDCPWLYERSTSITGSTFAWSCIGILEFHCVRKTVYSMQILPASWQAAARAKRLDIHSRIPKEWLLTDVDLEKAERQRNLTGTFIDPFLDDDEKDIIGQDSVSLTEKIKRREYTAVAVTHAFCKTAAIAQQIVSLSLCPAMQPIAVEIPLTRPRTTVFTKSCSTSQCALLRNWINILRKVAPSKVHYTVFQSA